MFRLHPKTSDTKVCIQQDLDGNIDDFKLSGSEMKALSILHYSEMFFHAHGKIPAVWLPFRDIMSTPKDLKKRGKEREGGEERTSFMDTCPITFKQMYDLHSVCISGAIL